MDTKTLLVIIGLIVIVGMAFLIRSQSPLDIFSTYQDSVQGIRIKYPINWVKLERKEIRQIPETRLLSEAEDIIVMFLRPKKKIGMLIVAEDLSAQPMSLEEYVDLNVQALEESSDIYIIEVTPITLARNPGYKTINHVKIFNELGTKDVVKQMTVTTVKKEKAYSITYEAGVDIFPEFLEIVQEMINSFEIL